MSEGIEQDVLEDATDMIDNWLNHRGHENLTPGISYAVVSEDEIIHKEQFGYADLSNEEQLADHRFSIASLSKIITATAIMKLREKNRTQLARQTGRIS